MKVVAACLNVFRGQIYQGSDDVRDTETASQMRQRLSRINDLATRVENDPSFSSRLRRPWRRLPADDVVFPILTEEYLQQLTFGSYQLKQAPGYIDANLLGSGNYEFEISRESESLIRARLKSRHSNAVKYYLWVELSDNTDDPVRSWYCYCKAGSRTVGMCSHLCSLISYLGVYRHSNFNFGPETKRFKSALKPATANE